MWHWARQNRENDIIALLLVFVAAVATIVVIFVLMNRTSKEQAVGNDKHKVATLAKTVAICHTRYPCLAVKLSSKHC